MTARARAILFAFAYTGALFVVAITIRSCELRQRLGTIAFSPFSAWIDRQPPEIARELRALVSHMMAKEARDASAQR